MLTPQEVAKKSFAKARMGGYNMAMVDEFLDELTEDYTKLYEENAKLKAKLKVLVEKVEEYRSTEESMRAALFSAQKMATTIVEEAKAKSADIVTSAEAVLVRRSPASVRTCRRKRSALSSPRTRSLPLLPSGRRSARSRMSS